MAIKTIPLSRLETDLKKTLDECAESGQAVVVEMPDHRLLAIQPLDPQEAAGRTGRGQLMAGRGLMDFGHLCTASPSDLFSFPMESADWSRAMNRSAERRVGA